MGQVLDAVVRSADATKAETLEIVQTRARREVVGLEAGLFILEIIVGISPLLGLLGAVTGLVKVFANIGSGVTSTTDLKGIASGISEALSTTIVGLAIAILALIAWSTFTRRVETLAIQMESLVIELIEKMFQRRGEPETDHHPDTLEEVTR
jgi:biopolymer transport protein ExbB